MSGNLKEVLVVGLGAVGSIYSFIIKGSGVARVTAVARRNYGIVNDQGIKFNSRKYENIGGWKPDRLCQSVAEAADSEYSYVVVTTKAVPEVEKTPELLSPFLSVEYNAKFKQPTYVLMQNGLNVEVDLFNALDQLQKQGVFKEVPRIIGCAIWIATNMRTPNAVECGDLNQVQMGAYRHQTGANVEEEVLDFESLINRVGGATTFVVPDIKSAKFVKNFWNLAFSSFATLTGHNLTAIFRAPPEDPASYAPFVYPITAGRMSEHTIPVMTAVLEEMLTVARALDFSDPPFDKPDSIVDSILNKTRELHEKADNIHTPSMLLDVQNGRPFEVEVIVGEVVRMAQARKIEIPRIELLYSMLLVIQNQLLGNRKVE